METLKLKIFEVLVNIISLVEFENWLYTSELLQEDLKEDSLLFEVVNINYRQDNAITKLKQVAFTIFNNEDCIAMKIEENCKKITSTKTSETIENYVFNIVQDFDFDFKSNTYWDFYNLYYSFDGYDFTKHTNRSLESLNLRAINLAKSVLETLKTAVTIEEKVLLLKKGKERNIIAPLQSSKAIEKEQKSNFTKKIFAFFKKS